MNMKLGLALVVACFLSSRVEAALQVGFYRGKCLFVEDIVRAEVTRSFFRNSGIAAGIVRLHFHDCFVRGCDGSLLIDSTLQNQGEKDSPANGITLQGLEVIDNAKARLEAVCKGVVSCADILAYAARDSVSLTGGLYWDVPAGRRDGRISNVSETVDIPAPFFSLDQITQSFAKKGLTQEEMIALSGAHTIGRSHCTSFANRLYNFSSTAMQDPSLNRFYAQILKQQCPRDSQGNVDQNLVVFMNQSPVRMDSSYYRNLFQNAGLLTSDQVLLDSQKAARQAAFYAANGLAWQRDFVRAMIKMSQIEVLTEYQGEIRANCRMVNS